MSNSTKDDLMRLLDNVKGVVPKHCDICGTKYGEESFSLVKDDAQHKVVHIKCHNCGNSYLLNIVNPAYGMVGSSRAQINLDISNAKELVKFASSSSISVNDALDAYNTFTSPDMSLNKWIKSKTLSKPFAEKVRRSGL